MMQEVIEAGLIGGLSFLIYVVPLLAIIYILIYLFKLFKK